MITTTGKRSFNLEQRTLVFAKRVREFIKKLPKTISNVEDSRQLVRSSGSVVANYVEADESLSKKDFLMRLRICRKESKESRIHLQLLDVQESDPLEQERSALAQEARELVLIFAAIIRKVE